VTSSAPNDEAALDDALSRPSDEACDALASLNGDIVVLGAGGKMGPSLARMARRALDARGVPRDGPHARRVYAVARFSDPLLPEALADYGVVPIRADLTNASALAQLPDAPNVLHLVGQKFGTKDDPLSTWAQNVGAAVNVAERYRTSRIVVFSTGNVYPRSVVTLGGVRENHALLAQGEYAASCVGRERMFAHSAREHHTSVLQFRLCYACDLRYGVLTDIAARVFAEASVPLQMGYANVIWQGDANDLALRALTQAAAHAPALNVSGPIVSVRELALQFAERLGRDVTFDGEEEADALVVNTERLRETLPFHALPLNTLVDWTADWVQRGGRLLGKPTRFDVRSGAY
jgi:hypothetical protein